MVLGAATGLPGLLLQVQTLKTVALGFLALGVVVGFVPLVAAGAHSLYSLLRGQNR
jgi:hypothetical protein